MPYMWTCFSTEFIFMDSSLLGMEDGSTESEAPN
jgi:hypothetical protein